MKKNLMYFVPLAIALLLLILVELIRPRPLDWTETYEKDDTIPYGSYIPYRLLPALFSQQSVRSASVSAYEVLDTTQAGNYIVIAGRFQPDEYDTRAILDFAHRGGTVFIAAEGIVGPLADTLGVETGYSLYSFRESYPLSLVNPAFDSSATMALSRVTLVSHFTGFDTASTIVLGHGAETDINFVAVPYGEGSFYLHSVPLAFTNYTVLLDSGYRYTAGALSYLPVQDVLWDEFYKDGRPEATTPLRYILSTEPLRWAWYVGLAAVALFIVFEARRRQRIVPVIEPPANATLDFVTMVGKLYYQHGDVRNIIDKKITYFLEYSRSRLNVRTAQLDAEFVRRVAGRSGVPEDDIRRIVNQIQVVRTKRAVDDDDLRRLHDAIDRFYRTSAR